MGKNKKNNKNISDELGYITVETLGTFIPFVFLVVSILSLVNIVTVQTRVHYALTQATNTISIYAHTLKLRSKIGAGELKDNIEDVLAGIGSLDFVDVIGGDDEIIGYVTDMIDGADFETLVRELIGRYLSNGSLSGGEYLKTANVIGGLDGLDLYNSDFLTDDGELSIVVEYEIEYKFGALPLPFEPKLKVTQQAKTKAWQGGAGEGYEG